MHYRLICLVVLVSVAAGPTRAGTGPVPVGTEAARAVLLVAKGDFEAAREVLRKAVDGRLDAPLHRAQLEGLILRKMERNREAVDVFRFILAREPNFTPARVELSRALAEIGDSDAALQQLQVIELGSTDPEIRRQARSYSESLKRQRPYGFSGYVAFLPSSNLNKGSGKRSFIVGDMEFAIDDDSRGQSGWGAGAGGNAYRTLHLNQATRLTWSGTINVEKYSGGDNNDLLTISTNLSLARRFGRIELQAGPTMDYRLLGWEPYAMRYGATLGALAPFGPNTQFYFGGTILKQDFETASYRDGGIFLGYAGIRHAFSPSLVVSVTGNFTAERTKRDYLDHDDFAILAQANREWGGGLVTSFAIGAGYHDYQGNFPGTAIARRDNVWSAGFTAVHREWSFQGFAPQFEYKYTRQKSNVSFYDYESHDAGVTFVKAF